MATAAAVSSHVCIIKAFSDQIKSNQTSRNGAEVVRGRSAAEWHSFFGLSSFVRRMPPELLGMIFFFCLDPSVTRDNNFAKTSILGVYRRWRNIALGTPAFWTSLAIPNSSMSPDIRDRRLDPFFPMNWLICTTRNSGSLSLDVTLEFPLHSTLFYAVLSFLQSTLYRCRSLTISGPQTGRIPGRSILPLRSLRHLVLVSGCFNLLVQNLLHNFSGSSKFLHCNTSSSQSQVPMKLINCIVTQVLRFFLKNVFIAEKLSALYQVSLSRASI
jgi:hypothetical protein